MRDERITVLVVDDEVKIVDVVKSFLEAKGMTVIGAETGAQALALFARHNISIVLLDLMLPDMRGEDVCASLRKTSRVPIIMVTAKVEEGDMLEGLGVGADDYITKPFSLKALAARINAVLRRSSGNLLPLFSKKTWRNGELEIEFESRTVTKRGAAISLTPNEYHLLFALIQYPNKVFTREELITIAFGDEYDGYSRAVDSHIKNLRQKIEDDPKTPVFIRTVHGVGYRFGAEP